MLSEDITGCSTVEEIVYSIIISSSISLFYYYCVVVKKKGKQNEVHGLVSATSSRMKQRPRDSLTLDSLTRKRLINSGLRTETTSSTMYLLVAYYAYVHEIRDHFDGNNAPCIIEITYKSVDSIVSQ